MIANTDYVGLGTLIGVTCTGIVSIIVALKTNNVQNKVAEVHEQVKTPNGATIGEIVAANDLTGVSAEHDPPRTP